MADYTAIKYNVPFSDAGSLKLITTTTISSDSTISFTSGISSTYKEYLFIFNNIHAATDNADLQFNGSIDAGSNYNVAKTTTNFRSYHFEGDDAAALQYQTSNDLAQGTGFQNFFGDDGVGNDNDQSAAGYMHLFNPNGATFVKHFMAVTNMSHASDISVQNFMAGYFNTTSDIDAVQFKFDTGNMDAGTIQMFGVL